MNQSIDDSFISYMNSYSRENQFNYERGMFSFLLSRDVNNNDINSLNKVYKGNGNSYKKPTNDIRNMVNDFVNHIEGSIEEASKFGGGVRNIGPSNNSNSNIGNN